MQKYVLFCLGIFTLAASSGKRNVTVWRPSVRPSVRLSRRHAHRYSPGGSMRRSQRTLRPDITRTDIIVTVKWNAPSRGRKSNSSIVLLNLRDRRKLHVGLHLIPITRYVAKPSVQLVRRTGTNFTKLLPQA